MGLEGRGRGDEGKRVMGDGPMLGTKTKSGLGEVRLIEMGNGTEPRQAHEGRD
jgi:hypothetical protein